MGVGIVKTRRRQRRSLRPEMGNEETSFDGPVVYVVGSRQQTVDSATSGVNT